MGSRARSSAVYEKAVELMPGGVNSPVRAWKGVGGTPVFFRSGKGARIFDVDDNEYIDYLGAWGPMILGHSCPSVIMAVEQAARRGLGFGAPIEAEVELAGLICGALLSIQKVRLVSSGTEAAMTATRIARAFTGRNKILKLEGCYHGHADQFLVRPGSGAVTLAISASPGVPDDIVRLTVVARFNDAESVERAIEEHGGEIASLILEPICGNCGVIPPEGDFLQRVRRVTRQHGIQLIFDEVITGFRVAWGGAQGLYGVEPDLTCLGKIVGGGLPIGAVGGRAELMDLLAPEGNVYQAGTNSGNPVAVAAGLATLAQLSKNQPYNALEARSQRLEEGLVRASMRAGLPGRVNRVGSMFWFYFGVSPVTDPGDASQLDRGLYERLFHALIRRGIYFPPSPFESCFVSCAHTEQDIDETIAAVESSLEEIRQSC